LKKFMLGAFVILVFSMALMLFGNVQAASTKGWLIENGGGTYSVSKGIISLSGSGIILYEPYVPLKDFTFSLKVEATTLQGFAIMLRGSLPFAGSADGVNFEFGARDGGSFTLARNAGGWTWTVFTTGAQTNVWYTMKLTVRSNPYTVTAQVFTEKSVLLGSYAASDMTSPAFSGIRYIGFGALESGGSYLVKGVSVSRVR